LALSKYIAYLLIKKREKEEGKKGLTPEPNSWIRHAVDLLVVF